MHIVVVTDEFSPLAGEPPFADQVLELSVGLKQSGCDVSVVLPMEDPAAVQTHSLARRLKSIRVEIQGAAYDWHRYDGRTADGLDVHLLHLKGDRPEDFSRVFAAAAAELLESGVQGDFCLGAGSTGLHLAPTLEDGGKCIALLFDVEKDLRGLRACKAAVRIGGAQGESLHEGTPVFTLTSWAQKPDVGTFEKSAAKASLQSTFALPISVEVPLVFIKDPGAPSIVETLAGALKRNLQMALITSDDSAYEELREKYPDRLALIPEGSLEAAALAAADLSMGHVSAQTVLSSLAVGTVPIAPAKSAEILVDLEPSLESGSGFITSDDSRAALDEALGRGLAAWTDRKAFTELQDRLPALVMTASDQAKRVLEILGI